MSSKREAGCLARATSEPSCGLGPGGSGGLWGQRNTQRAEVGGQGQEQVPGGQAHVLQEAGAQLAQVGSLPVELLLQRRHEGLLAPVDVLDVPEDGAQLLLAEHVGAPVTLPDVALGTGAGQSDPLWTPPQPPPRGRPHLADVAQVLDVVPFGAEDLVDDIGAHLVPAALCLGPAVLRPAIPGLVVGGLVLVHPQLQAMWRVSTPHPCGSAVELGLREPKRRTGSWAGPEAALPPNNAHLDRGTTGSMTPAAVSFICAHNPVL